MQDRRYLLSMEESSPIKLEGALDKLDESRRKKVLAIPQGRKQIESLCAGLLLQYAVQDAIKDAIKDAEHENHGEPGTGMSGMHGMSGMSGMHGMSKKSLMCQETPGNRNIIMLSWQQLLDKIEAPVPLEYVYGRKGKPFLQNLPYFFSLSHSGDYVFCVLSEQEVGADIQQKIGTGNARLVQRFFSREEQVQWEQYSSQYCSEEERRDFFYRMWCRKEAYGKLTGEGIGAAIGVNMCGTWEECCTKDFCTKDFCIEEWDVLPEYQLAVCKWKPVIKTINGNR